MNARPVAKKAETNQRPQGQIVAAQNRQVFHHKYLDRAGLLAHIKQLRSVGGPKIYAFYLEELAGGIGKEYRAPMFRIKELLSDLVATNDLQVVDGVFVYQGRSKTLTEEKIASQVKAAMIRKGKTFTDFLDAIEARGESCKAAKNLNLLWESIRSGAENSRSDVGFRGVYLFLLEGQTLRQAWYSSDRETSYKMPQEPAGIMKAVLESKEILHRVELKPDLAATKEQFKLAGFPEVDELWIRSLLDNHIGSIDLLKLKNEEGNPVGVLLLRDPVYFGKENQTRVDEKLVEFANSIGQRIQGIWDERGMTERLADGNMREKLSIGLHGEIEAVNGKPVSAGQKENQTEVKGLAETIVRFKSSTKTFKKNDRKVKTEIKYLKEPHLSLSLEEKKLLFAELRRVSQDAWEGRTLGTVAGYTDEYIEEHFIKTDKLALVFDPKTKELIGFVGLKKMNLQSNGTPFYLLEVGMIAQQYQELGIAPYLNRVMYGEALLENKGNPFIVATRTANPRVIGLFSSRMENCFPNPYKPDEKPTDEMIEVAIRVAGYLSPGKNFNPDTFVIEHNYLPESGLIFKPDEVPWYNEKAVNDYCQAALRFAEKAGNAFIFVGYFDAKVAKKHDKKSSGFAFGNAVLNLFLRASRSLT